MKRSLNSSSYELLGIKSLNGMYMPFTFYLLAWLVDSNESFQNDRLAILVSFILSLLEVKSDENEKRRRVDALSA